jgi:SAM-dependent methyltransferase
MAEVAASPAIARDSSNAGRQARTLFVVGFLVLFLELACIRWFAAYVVFLQFFTNVALLASFLGMSCGCMAARQERDWLSYFPFIALAAVLAAVAMFTAFHTWSGLVVDVGGQRSPQEVFFGTEYRDPDIAKFVIPIEVIAALFFLAIALIFVGPGQALGRAFDAYPNRVLGYTLNIGGSLAGIVGFSALAFLEAPAWAWFLIACIAIGYLQYEGGSLDRVKVVALIVLVVGISLPTALARDQHIRHWSPYYLIDHDIKAGYIGVNAVAHQWILSFASAGSIYSLIHLLNRHSGGAPFEDVLVIGAGSGNDVTHALKFGAKRVDAVEIDPAIQRIGREYHPDHPYQDPRVVPHLDDGRHFLRSTDQKFDLVAYALVDSLILHSGYANIRLESYLFTRQAFEDVRRVLKPDGIFVMYNFYRQDWIVQRIAAMTEAVFGCRPTVLSLPYEERVKDMPLNSFTMIIAGCNARIADAFAKNKDFWLATVPPRNLSIDGFTQRPETLPPDEARNFERIAPSAVDYGADTLFATDDWPFLYLRGRLIPDFTLRSMAMLGVLGIGMVYLFMPKGRLALNSRMFFLGAAFMLLETKAVVQMAVLFGSTWLVNSAVFFTILVLILLANLYVLKVQRVNLTWHYIGLVLILMAGALVPVELFLSGGTLWRFGAPCLLALGPMFFAGVIFARSFRDAPQPDLAFGSNIAGSVVGGIAESLSMLLGFQHLLLVALLFYLLSIWSPRARLTATAA